MMRSHCRMLLIVLPAMLGGCHAVKERLPEIPVPIASPKVQVLRVERVDVGPEAARYRVVMRVENPNDFALPLILADYRLQVGQARYAGDTNPLRTLPAQRSVQVELYAALPERGADRFDLAGSLEMNPPGKIRKVMYDLGLPRPRISFSAQGEVQAGESKL